jgi:hypothetical protein
MVSQACNLANWKVVISIRRQPRQQVHEPSCKPMAGNGGMHLTLPAIWKAQIGGSWYRAGPGIH